MAAKLRNERKKKAEATLQKVSGVLVSLETLLAKSDMQHVSELIRKPVEEAFAELTAIMVAATQLIADDGEGELLEEDLKVLPSSFFIYRSNHNSHTAMNRL